MKASFWKALDALGASGAALFTWKFRLGGEWDDSRPFLKATGRTADFVIDPRNPKYHLTVSPQSDAFVGYYEEETEIPPVPFNSENVTEFAPHWKPIAKALATAVGFDFGAWEADGPVRRIGSLQDPFGHVRPVLLFLPNGHLGDHASLVRSLIGRTDCTVLLPTSRWITGEIEHLRDRNGLAFVDLSERLAQTANSPDSPAPLPATGSRKSTAVPTVRAVIRAVDGLTWDQVRIEVGASRTIHLKAPGQSGKFVFPPNSQLQPDHPLGMLMHLAAHGEWRNPSLGSPEYERVSRAFRRLRKLLMTLVPLPGAPFQSHRGAFVPAFQIGIHQNLVPDGRLEP